jgi:hypothetical protein
VSRRRARSDARVDRKGLLAALGECRAAVLRASVKMAVNGPLYYSAATVVSAIDGLALLLTGERDYFHLQGHGVTAPIEGPRLDKDDK